MQVQIHIINRTTEAHPQEIYQFSPINMFPKTKPIHEETKYKNIMQVVLILVLLKLLYLPFSLFTSFLLFGVPLTGGILLVREEGQAKTSKFEPYNNKHQLS